MTSQNPKMNPPASRASWKLSRTQRLFIGSWLLLAIGLYFYPIVLYYPAQAPDWSQVDNHPEYLQIKRGREIVENTPFLLPDSVGAHIQCTHCHLQSATKPYAGHWIGLVHAFPQYRDRSGKKDTLEDRINDCFERSLNGQRLAHDSLDMKAILAYINWLSKDIPKPHFWQKVQVNFSGMPKLQLPDSPDLTAGQSVYEQKCQSCHQAEGTGLVDLKNQRILFPPLAGEKAFNIGAGMARLHTAAGFIYYHMPLGQDRSLTQKEAWNVAAYVTQLNRPDFKSKAQDWPKGNKPMDARY